jgi:hypothetical protein
MLYRCFTLICPFILGWLFPGCHKLDWSTSYHLWSGRRKSWSSKQTYCTFHSGMNAVSYCDISSNKICYLLIHEKRITQCHTHEQECLIHFKVWRLLGCYAAWLLFLVHRFVSVLTRATWCNIPEDATLHSRRCENLKSYIDTFLFTPAERWK